MLQARTDGFEFIEPDTRGTLALVRKGGHYGANLDVSFSVRGAAGEFVPLAPSRRFAIESVPFSKPPRCRGMLKRALARSRPRGPPPLQIPTSVAQGYPLSPRGEPGQLGCRRRVAVALRCRP